MKNNNDNVNNDISLINFLGGYKRGIILYSLEGGRTVLDSTWKFSHWSQDGPDANHFTVSEDALFHMDNEKEKEFSKTYWEPLYEDEVDTLYYIPNRKILEVMNLLAFDLQRMILQGFKYEDPAFDFINEYNELLFCYYYTQHGDFSHSIKYQSQRLVATVRDFRDNWNMEHDSKEEISGYEFPEATYNFLNA